MKDRLEKRGQPELISEDMVRWNDYIRRQAEGNPKMMLIDTSKLSKNESHEDLKSAIKRIMVLRPNSADSLHE
jgi:hypothetical protein